MLEYLTHFRRMQSCWHQPRIFYNSFNGEALAKCADRNSEADSSIARVQRQQRKSDLALLITERMETVADICVVSKSNV
jgi:hypothetical protein